MRRKEFKRNGFTLIELIIALAILALILALALPSYENSIRKSHRSEAQTAMLGFANTAERIYSENASYATVSLPPNSNYYTFSFPAAATATTFSIRATPTALQVKDKCGTMTLTNTGVKTSTGSEANCW